MKLNKSKLRFISGFVCGALIFGSIGAFANGAFEKITAELKPDLPLYINGEKLELQNGAIFYKDTNFLSLREVAEASGLDVYWNPETQEIELNSIDDVDGGTDDDSANNDNLNNNNEKDDDSLDNEVIENEIDFTYEDKGTSKVISVGQDQYLTIDFFDFNFTDRSNAYSQHDKDIVKVLEYKFRLFIPEDYKHSYIPTFSSLFNDDSNKTHIHEIEGGVEKLNGKTWLEEGDNFFQMQYYLYSENEPTEFTVFFRNIHGEESDILIWKIE